MPAYRATVRWMSDRQRYHVEDVEAPDFATALDRIRGVLPPEVAAGADLLELRRQAAPDEREHAVG